LIAAFAGPWSGGHSVLFAVTGFGDSAVLLPLAAMILWWLVLSGAPRLAAWWAAAVVLCSGVTAGLKILFWGCSPIADLHSPSGHTSFATLVYGAIALFVADEIGGWRGRAAAIGGAALVMAIALSRLLLGAHRIPEILLGGIIGIAFLAAFGCAYRRRRPPGARLAPLLVAAVLLATVLHGSELHAEVLLHRITLYLGIACG
jgi:membrane-associated phospholipid phosphatase